MAIPNSIKNKIRRPIKNDATNQPAKQFSNIKTKTTNPIKHKTFHGIILSKRRLHPKRTKLEHPNINDETATKTKPILRKTRLKESRNNIAKRLQNKKRKTQSRHQKTRSPLVIHILARNKNKLPIIPNPKEGLFLPRKSHHEHQSPTRSLNKPSERIITKIRTEENRISKIGGGC